MTREDAHAALMAAVRAPHTRPVPCLDGDPAWTSDDLAEQADVAPLCAACPVLDQCRAYLETWGETAGCWAGLTTADRIAHTGKPKQGDR